MREKRKMRGRVKRDCQVNIKLSEKEKARLELLAEDANMHKNAFVAMLVSNWSNEDYFE